MNPVSVLALISRHVTPRTDNLRQSVTKTVTATDPKGCAVLLVFCDLSHDVNCHYVAGSQSQLLEITRRRCSPFLAWSLLYTPLSDDDTVRRWDAESGCVSFEAPTMLCAEWFAL
jgi:hypothetical protein